MWSYYTVTDPMSGGGKPLALFRVEGVIVERYEGLGRWVEPSGAGRVLMDVSGMGEGWSGYVEVKPEKLDMVKLQLYPDDLSDD